MVLGLGEMNRYNAAVAGVVAGGTMMAHSYCAKPKTPKPEAQPEGEKSVRAWNWKKIEGYTGAAIALASAASLLSNRNR